MKPFVLLFTACVLICAGNFQVRAQDATVEDRYFDIYSLILRADTQAARGQTDRARTNYYKAVVSLKKLQEDYPLWNAKVVKFRLDYLAAKVTAMTPAKTPGAPAAKRDLSEEPVTPGDSNDPVELKQKLKAGQRFTLTQNSTHRFQSDQLDRAALTALNGTTTSVVAISVLQDRDGGGQEVELQEVSSKSNGHDVAGDPIRGVAIKYLTDARGNVESIENLDEVLDRVASAVPAAQRESVRKALSESLKDTLSTGGEELPENPVKVGETWEHQSKKSVPAPTGNLRVQVNSKYTFRGWSTHETKKYAVIEYAGNFATGSDANAASPAGESGNPALKFTEDGTVSGRIWFSPEQQMIVQEAEKGSYNIQMTVNGRSMTMRADDDSAATIALASAAK